jgi:hypothetical protein
MSKKRNNSYKYIRVYNKINIKMEESTNKKVIIETSADLFKLPLEVIKNTPIYHFKGKYFNKLYEEALKIERSGGKIDSQEQSLPIIESIQFEINYNTKVIYH